MARSPEGWRLVYDERRGTYYVRFRVSGRRHTLSTRETEAGPAATAASRLYAEAVSGRRRRGPAIERVRPEQLDVLVTRWLEAVEPELDPTTVEQYELYSWAHWQPFFRTLDRITASGATDYIRARLKRVKRTTVLKELAALRGFLRWCVDAGHLDEAPVIKPPHARATGTPDRKRNPKREPTPLEPEEIERVLEQLQRETRRGGRPWAYHVVMWETALRHGTLAELEAPGDYHRRRKTLRIRAEIDKARTERELPITARARAALDSVCPKRRGLLFGPRRYREALKAAAKAAGLPARKWRRISAHDLRHARLTAWGSAPGATLAGVAYLAGHKNVTTTARYVHPGRRAAEAVLEAAAALEER